MSGTGRSVIVTGAAQGLGRGIAIRLAADGFKVLITDLQVEKLNSVQEEIRSKGHIADTFIGDITKKETVQELIAKAVELYGKLDVMIANAGILIQQPIHEVNEDDWDKLMNVNVRATMLCFKYSAQQMIKQGHGGVIIGATSMAGKRGQPSNVSYSTSKFAIRGLIQASAIDLGRFGIRVNGYAPGVCNTALLTQAIENKSVPYTVEMLKSATALHQIGEVEDVAALVSFLVSPEAKFITGQSYNVCGGTNFD